MDSLTSPLASSAGACALSAGAAVPSAAGAFEASGDAAGVAAHATSDRQLTTTRTRARNFFEFFIMVILLDLFFGRLSTPAFYPQINKNLNKKQG